MSKSPVFALVDCDNFFVSCERVFRPELWNKPVAVLSNNDGCVVARSNEVKALGVPMGVPYFKVKGIFKAHNITMFSGNFALYGDFSQRVVRLLEEAAPTVEVYSVDESFLELSTLGITNYTQWAETLRARIWQWLGIPVSIGVAPTKTLAKAAAEKAKHTPSLKGAYSLQADTTLSSGAAEVRQRELLKEMPVQEVWGIGRRTAPKLLSRGLRTAYDLSQVTDAWAQQQLTIRGLHTVKELRGEPCLPVEESKPQKSLAVTRTFAGRVRTWHDMESYVATFTARAAQKLRQQGQVCGAIMVFIAGDRHRDGDNYRRVSTCISLVQPTNDSAGLIAAALKGLEQLFDPDFSYRRAGIACIDLTPEDARQLSWLNSENPQQIDRRTQLMTAVDTLNEKYHTRLVRQAVERPSTTLRFGTHHSHAFTTDWRSLPTAKA
jgi:DNA polymerase V